MATESKSLIKYIQDIEEANNRFHDISDIEITKTVVEVIGRKVETILIEYKALKKLSIDLENDPNLWIGYNTYLNMDVSTYKMLKRDDLINDICSSS